MKSQNTISEYYRGKTILVTGASGFIGKVLIWKLLKSCSHLDTIYILVRPKYGNDIQFRVTEMLQAPVSVQYNYILVYVVDEAPSDGSFFPIRSLRISEKRILNFCPK